MANVVQTMINSALGDGARSSKFECIIGLDSFSGGSKMISAVVKTSQFPGISNEVIDFKFKGRNIPLRGQTTHGNTWTCTFYLDEMHSLKSAFEAEIEALDNHLFADPTNMVRSALSRKSRNYTKTLTIIQLDFDGTQQAAIYNLYNVFPKSVSSVETDYSAVGTVQEFTVEFSYSHHEVHNIKGSDGSFIDSMKDRFLNAVDGLIQKGKDAAIGALSSVIGSARDFFTTGSASSVGDVFSGIGGSISKGIASLEQIDFNPSRMIE